MVKGISKQVIVVHSPDPKLFEQAIFILKEDAIGQEGVTDAVLLKEANRLIREPSERRKRKLRYYGPVWALGGAAITAGIWIATVLL
jgi:hypothetical protein